MLTQMKQNLAAMTKQDWQDHKSEVMRGLFFGGVASCLVAGIVSIVAGFSSLIINGGAPTTALTAAITAAITGCGAAIATLGAIVVRNNKKPHQDRPLTKYAASIFTVFGVTVAGYNAGQYLEKVETARLAEQQKIEAQIKAHTKTLSAEELARDFNIACTGTVSLRTDTNKLNYKKAGECAPAK